MKYRMGDKSMYVIMKSLLNQHPLHLFLAPLCQSWQKGYAVSGGFE